MKYSPRRSGGWLESACSKLPFYEVAGTINFTAESVQCIGRGCLKQKEFFEAGSVRHSSTNFFVVWKSSEGIFPRVIFRTRWHGAVKWRDGNCHREGASANETTSTTKGTKDHEGLRSFVASFA